MSILIKRSGILATLQDGGRRGFARFGINPGGPMDRAASRIANIICGNDDRETLLELHFPAPAIEFEEPVVAALAGADFGALLNDSPIAPWRSFNASPGDILSFTCRIFGARAYLAVRGGFDGDEWLGSSATNLRAGIGGFGGRMLMKNDRIGFRRATRGVAPAMTVSARLRPIYSNFPTVRVLEGPEFDLLDGDSKRLFRRSGFEITRKSDRMGFRLAGPDLNLLEPFEMVSAGANFGTVQLLPDGQLVILMADHQTSGGYPRIATVIPTDLPLVAQVPALGKLGFHPIPIAEAERHFFDFERDLSFLRVGCKFRLDALD